MPKAPDFYEIAVHNCPITSLCLSSDEQFLITGDENGIIFMLRIREAFEDAQVLDVQKVFQSEERARIEQVKNDLFLASTEQIVKKNVIRKKFE